MTGHVEAATHEQFRTEAKTLKAVAADLMIIGEAANHVPDDVQDANADMPWVVMRVDPLKRLLG